MYSQLDIVFQFPGFIMCREAMTFAVLYSMFKFLASLDWGEIKLFQYLIFGIYSAVQFFCKNCCLPTQSPKAASTPAAGQRSTDCSISYFKNIRSFIVRTGHSRYLHQSIANLRSHMHPTYTELKSGLEQSYIVIGLFLYKKNMVFFAHDFQGVITINYARQKKSSAISDRVV